MSIKIIKGGSIPRFLGMCNVCGCEFECDFTDVAFAPSGMFVICPTCHHSLEEWTGEIKQLDSIEVHENEQ